MDENVGLNMKVNAAVSSILVDMEGVISTRDPCVAYTVLDSTNRQHTVRENNGVCDNNLVEGWYKFEIEGRPAEIPLVCLQNNVCGTQLPLRIDLEGNAMPTPGEILETYACTSYDVLGKWDCCVLRQPVKIANCNDFYIYHLRPTDRCPVAYCAQEIGVNPSDEVTIKRGDVPNQSSTTTTANSMSTTSDSNLTETTAGTSEYRNTTTVPDSSSVFAADTGQNMTENVTTESTVSNTTLESSTDRVATSPSEIMATTLSTDVSAADNTTDTLTTDIGGVVSTAGDNNVTASTADMAESTTINMTTNEQTTMIAETVDLTTKDINGSSTENTTVNTTQSTTVNLECENWTQMLCNDGRTTCYLSPVNNETFIVCADDSGCGALCDDVPDCTDGSDENNADLCPSNPVCLEGQELCSDGSACYNRCDGHITCDNSTAGEDENGCFTTSTLSPATTNITFTSENRTINVSTPSDNVTSSAVTQSTLLVSVSTEGQTENETTAQLPASTSQTSFSATTAVQNTTASENVSLTTTDSSETTDGMTTDSSETTDGMTTDSSATTYGNGTESSVITEGITTESSITNDSHAESATASQSTVTGLTTSVNVRESSTAFIGSTDANITTVIATTQSDTVSTQSESESSTEILTTRISTTDSSKSNVSTTTVSELTESSIPTTLSSAVDDTLVGELSTVASSISTDAQTTQSTESLQQTTVIPDELSHSSSQTTELTTGSTLVTTEDGVDTSPVSASLSPDTSDTVVISKAESTVSTSRVTSHVQTTESTTSDVRTATHSVLKTSSDGDATILPDHRNTSDEFSPVTGPQPTSTADNQTDHTMYATKEKKSLFYENFGLFVFLIVAGAVIVGVCLFGIIGYRYQRRLRTWNPTMAYQDAYGDLEKTTLSFGHDKHGIDSPIPDFDILRDEKKFEETSLSQASTLALGPTPGRTDPPFDDTYNEAFPDKMTNGKPSNGTSQQDNEVSYVTNGHTNEGFVADDNADGVVPIDDLDTSAPRSLFPWIENAADTKL
ncbi:serine-rich adhesin for platelets-like [Mercenaria mercenaria]|uniref:serine-rich adhesin for platelets-like n=1 Tax=Mercenaria mercenaria TaxID=6596 RepID=UPI00234E64B0|nr:serine-rich adhesin for platelets-like [Mercenaria mercenaria]